MRHLHYFLWVLAYGYGQEEGGAGGVVWESIPLSLYHFPWAKAVKQLPSPSSLGQGWVDLKDIVANMPFVLCIILFNFSGASGGVKQSHDL